MNSTKNRTVRLKKMMAIAGLFWFLYLIFHLFSVLTFHSGEAAFSSFYVWLNSSLLYPILLAYPKAIPRVVAWSGASIILIFIVIHSVQMLTIDPVDLYSELQSIFQNPLMWAVYGLGMVAISTHLHHGLTNVLQTLGITSKQCKGLALIIVLVIMVGFVSIPFGILYAKV